MELSVRAFVLDTDDNILLVKHAANQMRTLPGGHVEDDETVYEGLIRELEEELDISATVIGSDTIFSNHSVVSLPLPISIHKVRYEHRNRGEVEKLEYIFFARTDGEVEDIQNDEIYDWQWVSIEDFLALDDSEIHDWMQELLEQSEDLLSVL